MENENVVFGSGISATWLRGKEEKAISLISDWLKRSEHRVYGSISGGKDSLVMAYLIRKVYPDCPFLWVNQGHLAEWKGCKKLLCYLRDELGWNIIELCPPQGLIQLYKKYGLTFDGKFNSIDKKHCEELLLKPVQEWCEINDILGYAWGLRKESRGRTMYLSKHGLLHQRKDGMLVCSPVGFWTTQDIWNYIDWQRIPYAEIYDIEGRLNFRNGCPIDTALSCWGKLANLRKKYPDIYFELETIFPEVRNYV